MLARIVATILCLVPLSSVLLSFAVSERAEGLGLLLLGTVLFVCSALIAWSNFYYLWLRLYLQARRTGSRDGLPYISGVPLLGNLCSVAIWILPASVLTSVLALFVIAIDLGGALWILPSLWERSAQATELTLRDTGKETLNLVPKGPIQQYDVVRIVRLNTPSRHYDGTQGISRAPRVGDVGAVIELRDSGTPNEMMIVEATDEEGRTLWLADFSRGELELVSKAA